MRQKRDRSAVTAPTPQAVQFYTISQKLASPVNIYIYIYIYRYINFVFFLLRYVNYNRKCIYIYIYIPYFFSYFMLSITFLIPSYHYMSIRLRFSSIPTNAYTKIEVLRLYIYTNQPPLPLDFTCNLW